MEKGRGNKKYKYLSLKYSQSYVEVLFNRIVLSHIHCVTKPKQAATPTTSDIWVCISCSRAPLQIHSLGNFEAHSLVKQGRWCVWQSRSCVLKKLICVVAIQVYATHNQPDQSLEFHFASDLGMKVFKHSHKGVVNIAVRICNTLYHIDP